jgi:hypothetical protein
VNSQVPPVSRGKNVWCHSNRSAISHKNCFGFVDSVPPFYLHMKYRDIKLCAVQLEAYVLSLSDQMQQPILMKLEFLVLLLLKIQNFRGGDFLWLCKYVKTFRRILVTSM